MTMAQITDEILDEIFAAMKQGVPIFTTRKDLNVDEAVPEIRKQLVARFTRDEFQRVIKEHVRPSMNDPVKRIEFVVRKVVRDNPDRLEDVVSKLLELSSSL